MKKPRTKVKQDPKTELVAVSFSPGEKALLDTYIRRKRLKSRSGFIRRVVMNAVLGDTGSNKATLFDLPPEKDPV